LAQLESESQSFMRDHFDSNIFAVVQIWSNPQNHTNPNVQKNANDRLETKRANRTWLQTPGLECEKF